MQNKKFSEALNGKGYYIALILCAIAIGISGYLYYQNVSEVVDPSDVPAINTDGNHRPGETLPDPTTNPTTPTNPKKGLKATVSPLTGEKVVDYAMDCLTYNPTTRDWRTHDGIDIAAEEGAEVYAGADGEVTGVYYDNYYGRSVEITHPDGIVSVYSNLDGETINVKVGDTVKTGARIGKIGDSSLTELADEAHLHFAVKVNGVNVNPLDYITEESKSASLGIK